MNQNKILLIILYLFFTQTLFSLETKQLSFEKDIKPILDKRCVVCHSCYNSPCQLKLSSFDGLIRGATKEEIYNNRIKPATPSRLFIDAHSKQEWEELGFYSVLKKYGQSSIMMEFLEQKQKKPLNIGEYAPEEDELTCSKNMKELEKYFKDNPYHGMPYGFPPILKHEHELLIKWLQGEIKEDKNNSVDEPKEIALFEKFLNNKQIKYQVSARYIYEHLYLAHIKFPSSESFYTLLRMDANTHKPIKTRVPYGDADTPIYYKLQKITSTIVHKTHMVYKIDENKLKKFHNLFIDTKWNSEAYMPSYKTDVASNPLLAFKQIPLQTRYRFMLDDIEYFIRTFIRGPVCKGQIALNVIRDHFWIVFKDPEFDYTIKDNHFIDENLKNLSIPNEYGGDTNLFKLIDIYKYNEDTIKYYKNKNELYKSYGNDLSLQSIWKGNHFGSTNNDAVLTVYRHFDSASVHNGALGEIPKTMWVIDYPLLERLYYSLVAGFDVYGNTQHKVLVRKYMDRLRIEGESNLLEYLPKYKRNMVFDSWYQGPLSKSVVTYTPSNNEATLKYDYKTFATKILEYTKTPKDLINFQRNNFTKSLGIELFNSKEDIEKGLKDIVFNNEIDKFKEFSSDNFNLIYIRFKLKDQEDQVYTMVVNRWHDNVAFMFNEKFRRNVKKDKVNFIEGFIGSYPNYFVVVEQEDIKEFFALLRETVDEKKLSKFFINRNNKNFWKEYDWFQKRFEVDQPIESGVFDLNRYYKKSI